MATQEQGPGADEDRRAFLKAAGRAAVVAPPAMTLMLTTTMNSPAIAASGGGVPAFDELAAGGPAAPHILTETSLAPPAQEGRPQADAAPAPRLAASGGEPQSPSRPALPEDKGSGSPAAIKWPGMLFAGLLALLGLAG